MHLSLPDKIDLDASKSKQSYVNSCVKYTTTYSKDRLDVNFCNVRSMFPKMDMIDVYLQKNSHVDMIFFTESWLTPNISDSMVSLTNFSVMRSDRTHTTGGGVALLFKNIYHVKQVEIEPSVLNTTNNTSNFEYLCVDCFTANNDVTRLICFYLPPKYSSCIDTVRTLCKVIKYFSNPLSPCFVFGDFNMPNINWAIPSSTGLVNDYFVQFFLTNGYKQNIIEPTHDKLNTLDLLFSNVNGNGSLISFSVDEPISPSCDHNLISFSIQSKIRSHIIHKSTYPNFRKADYDKILEHLLAIDWENLNFSTNFQDAYDSFLALLHNSIEKYIPISSQSKNYSKIPRHIKDILSKKKKIYKKSKRNKHLKQEYKKISSEYAHAVQQWTNKIESGICSNPSSKKFYSYVNNKFKCKSSIPPLHNVTSGRFCVTESEKANLLNGYFQSVFTQDDGKPLPNLKKPTVVMENFQITSEDVRNAIAKMKDKISKTPENIPSFFIKRVSAALIKPLTLLFNASLSLGKVPYQWKRAIITPIHKKNDKSKPNNYRPISLTSSFSRIFESILQDKLLSHILANNLISSSQFGFLPNKSTCSQLITCIHEWFLSISKESVVNIIYTDISKAFNSVSHSKLLQILTSYGISLQVINWLKDFLNNRKQTVCIGSTFSSPLSVLSGVPQGSVIGPLLFLLFINGITSAVSETYGVSGIKLFADDAKLYGTNSTDLQCSLDKMVVWLQEHQLNIAKEKCFSLTLARKKSTHNPNHFSINSNSISNKTHFRDLGVIISDDLKWTHHVNSICTSAEVKSYQILKCFKTKNIGVLLGLFKTYVRPKLEYNTPVWSPYLLKNVNKIESVQRNYTKRICRRCGINFSSYEDRLNILNLNTLEK